MLEAGIAVKPLPVAYSLLRERDKVIFHVMWYEVI